MPTSDAASGENATSRGLLTLFNSPYSRLKTPSQDQLVEQRRPCTRLHLGSIACAAVLLRAIVFLAVHQIAHRSIDDYARSYDGNSYIITAQAMTGDRSQYNEFHGRVFPGYPALIALLHCCGVPFAAGAVGIDWVCAGLAASLAAGVFSDRRVGWAMVFFFPHYLMNSSMALSEAPLLAFSLAGVLLAQKRGMIPGGMLLGMAGLIRPMACFAALGYGAAQCIERAVRPRDRLRRLALFGCAAGGVFAMGLILLHRWRGDAFASARYYANSPSTYDGDLFTWPFHALLTVPIHRHIPIARVLYVYAHVVMALAACAMLCRKFVSARGRLDYRDALAGPWLCANTCFALCTGSIWGFECFHRFTIPALPAMFWALRAAFPKRKWMLCSLTLTSVTIAIGTSLHDL